MADILQRACNQVLLEEAASDALSSTRSRGGRAGLHYFNQFDQALANPKLDPHPKPAPSLFRFGNVAIIGDLNLPQYKKCRVLQKLEAINTLGVANNYSHWQDIPRSLNLMQMASTAIIYPQSHLL
jgi:hypothetical protein